MKTRAFETLILERKVTVCYCLTGQIDWVKRKLCLPLGFRLTRHAGDIINHSQ
jgi:hypothetical protein